MFWNLYFEFFVAESFCNIVDCVLHTPMSLCKIEELIIQQNNNFCTLYSVCKAMQQTFN